MQKVELLSPAGNFEKLKTAFNYGADACYFAGTSFGLRAFADNFDDDALKQADETEETATTHTVASPDDRTLEPSKEDVVAEDSNDESKDLAEDDIANALGQLYLIIAVTIGIRHIEPLISAVPGVNSKTGIVYLPVAIRL